MIEMFAKMLVSFTIIIEVFTSDIAYNHAEELPKVPLFSTPGSDISGSSLGGTYANTKFPSDPWKTGDIPSVHSDFIQEFSTSQAQQPPSEVENPVFKPVGLGLDRRGRVPRVPKFSHCGSPRFRPPPKVWSPLVWTPPSPPPPPVWAQPPPPPLTVEPPTIQPPSVWSPLSPVDPPFESPTPTPTADLSPFREPTSATEPPNSDVI